MQIPAILTGKVLRIFGERGREWLAGLPQLYSACIKKWGLFDCSLAPDLSINLVCFAESPAWGPVALKVGVPHSELFTEAEALRLYDGRHICACYDFAPELGAMLLERIVPGWDLNVLPCVRDRTTVAADLAATMPIPAPQEHGLPSYADWIDRAFARARKGQVVGDRMLSFVDLAEGLFREIEAAGRPRMLLHGDLHHANILQGQNGCWKAIDPKGVIGAQCLEAARFIENQFEKESPDTRLNSLDEMTALFGARLGEPREEIARCLFVDRVLSTCWKFEDDVDPRSLGGDVEDCAAFLAYLKAFRH